MTLRRALERLEAVSPAAKMTEETVRVLPAALRIALRDQPTAISRVCSTLEWEDAVAPFGLHLSPRGIAMEQERRLNCLLPVLDDIAGPDAVRLFLACLAFNLVNE